MKIGLMPWHGKVLAFTLLIISLTLSGQEIPGGPGGPGAMEIIVPVGIVEEKEDMEVNNYSGVVLSPQSVRIVSRVSGELLEVGFKDGDQIKQGQLLYRLDDTKYQATVKKIRAMLAQGQARAEYAQKNYERTNALYAKEITTLDALESTQSTLKAMLAAVAETEADLISAEEDLKDCIIRAPIDGMVTTTNYTVGNYLTPSSGPLVNLFQISPVRVRFFISTRDYLDLFGSPESLRTDSRITLVLANGEVYPAEGEIELMSMEANRNTDTVQIYALFDNPEYKLLPNSTVKVTLAKKNSKKLPAIPSSAVMFDTQGAYVWLVENGDMVRKQHVVLGNTDGETQMILSGLSAGAEIVTDGTHKVMNGVMIVPDRQGR